MTHRFPIKEIARQAGLGTATIDRVLNNRANVSTQTKQRVAAAIEELTAQEAQLAARGRRMFFDFVIEAPARFSREVKSATEAVLPHINSAVCRPRFLLQEIMQEAEVVAALERIQKRGSHGVCLKAKDTPAIRAAVRKLHASRIPVVTLVTDLGGGDRLSYVGLDNAGAGRTAAYLISKTLGDRSGTVLATRSHERFLGEEDRATAFQEALVQLCPNLRVISLQGGGGIPSKTATQLTQKLEHVVDLQAVYSMGGGNRAILETLEHCRLSPLVFVAHDLDRENKELLIKEKISFVLHHDLQRDIRAAFDHFLAFHKLLTEPTTESLSTAQVLTPMNILVD
ncbi:MAG: substrate-binding domain-containing protein [Shimia sp.]|uniref:LacI family DNA-binding transcriptional regulator n=1 Tax=Shimia sp. TaxID=1954381 RepID=UPI001B2C595E|nr:LacI family DNA-binding transcriptional regulator [Shimia sp.]MBO6898049.1 substrate-binding domain-containing protein [Shimia sp.]